MSAKTDALEIAVTELLRAQSARDAEPCARSRAAVDRSFARLAALAAPRIRYFIARYGLTDMVEDAEQVCAIALHRAIAIYNPKRARFTTFVNWQLRGELQALRFRLRADQRSAARRVAATTVSLDSLADLAPDEDWLADPAAPLATEAGAADHLAAQCADRLVDGWAKRRRAQLARRTGAAPAGSCRPGTAPPEALARIEAKLAEERAQLRRQLTAAGAAPTGRLRESDRLAVRRALADNAQHASHATRH